ncbi:MAG: restriction endonuclease subunit S [Flavisolibacter sp.]
MTELNGHSIEWANKKMQDVCEITSSKRIFQSDYIIEGIPFYRTKEVKELSEGKQISIELFISKKKYEEIKDRFGIPQKGDILVSAVGTIGVSYIISDDKPFYFKDGNLVWLKNLQGVEPKFLKYYIDHFIRFKNSIETSGSAYNALTIVKLKNFSIPVPSVNVQQQIVSKIEELFSELDKSIELLKTAQQQLKVYRQSVLKWAFEGKLTNENVKDGELPDGWQWMTLRDFIEKIEAGKSFKCDERTPMHNEVGVLKVSAVTWGEFDENESKTVTDKSKVQPSYFIQEGDFLFSRANTIELVGAAVIVRHVKKTLMLSDKTLRLIFNQQVNNSYVLYFLRCKKGRNEIKSLSTGNQESMRNIGQERIRQIQIPFCSIEEQSKVVEEIESRFSVADKLEETITNSLQQAEALRQSILKKAFDGKLNR